MCENATEKDRVLKSSQDSNLGLLNGSQMLLWSQTLELWDFKCVHVRMCLADTIDMMCTACV